MTPEAQRIAIAEACGWQSIPRVWKTEVSGTVVEGFSWIKPDGKEVSGGWGSLEAAAKDLPDYLNDLNAMHESVTWLLASKPGYYERTWFNNLHQVATGIDPYSDGWGDVDARSCAATTNATAAQRAEAFLKTLGLWEDTKP